MSKIALITGVSRPTGLGIEIVRQMAELDYTVYASARQIRQVRQLVTDLAMPQKNIIPISLDITNQSSLEAAIDRIASENGRLDTLVNNAGAFFDEGARALETEMDFVRQAFETNTLGAWRLIQLCVPLLEAAGHATVVNVTSGAGSFSDPQFGMAVHRAHVPTYAMTKAAENAITVKLAKELKPLGVLVNAVCPGWVATFPGMAEMGAGSVEKGAHGLVWAATLGPDGPHGGFFRGGQSIGW
ncbi:MAG: SDR family NAD(P)-dependent oxidoreductase [Bacteroidota bacterium]